VLDAAPARQPAVDDGFDDFRARGMRARGSCGLSARCSPREVATASVLWAVPFITLFFAKKDLSANRKRTQRLYREEGLTVRRRRGRKRATGPRAPLIFAALTNAHWSMLCLASDRGRDRSDEVDLDQA
jgi:hypothetical protein